MQCTVVVVIAPLRFYATAEPLPLQLCAPALNDKLSDSAVLNTRRIRPSRAARHDKICTRNVDGGSWIDRHQPILSFECQL